jgi:hypothetical protein
VAYERALGIIETWMFRSTHHRMTARRSGVDELLNKRKSGVSAMNTARGRQIA